MVTHAGPSIVPIHGLPVEYRECVRPTGQYAPTTYLEAAVRQAAEKDFAAAEWLLQIARDLGGDEAALMRTDALIRSEQGDADAARQKLEEWLSAHPQDTASAALLAVLLEEAGRHDEAIVVARRIVDDLSVDHEESAAARATAQRVLTRCQEQAR
jgi:predicted Zn-dependent protease